MQLSIFLFVNIFGGIQWREALPDRRRNMFMVLPHQDLNWTTHLSG